jgi:hypothetical protein
MPRRTRVATAVRYPRENGGTLTHACEFCQAISLRWGRPSTRSHQAATSRSRSSARMRHRTGVLDPRVTGMEKNESRLEEPRLAEDGDKEEWICIGNGSVPEAASKPVWMWRGICNSWHWSMVASQTAMYSFLKTSPSPLCAEGKNRSAPKLGFGHAGGRGVRHAVKKLTGKPEGFDGLFLRFAVPAPLFPTARFSSYQYLQI